MKIYIIHDVHHDPDFFALQARDKDDAKEKYILHLNIDEHESKFGLDKIIAVSWADFITDATFKWREFLESRLKESVLVGFDGRIG